MKTKPIAIAVLTLALLAGGAFYFSNSSDLQGRFNSKNTFGPPSSLNGSSQSSSSATSKTETLLSAKTDDNAAGGYSVDGYQLLGAWELSLSEEASACKLMSFSLFENGKSVGSYSDVFDDTRLYVGTGDIDFEEKIANDDYVSYGKDPLTFSSVDPDYFTPGETRYLQLYGDFEGDEFSSDVEIDHGTVYLRSICVYDSERDSKSWNVYDTGNSDHDYFEMDSDTHGIPGGVDVNF